MIVLDASDRAICVRQPWLASPSYILTSGLPVFTAAMFMRRSFLTRTDLQFDPDRRAVSDAVFFLEARRAGAVLRTTRRVLSTFLDDGQNLSLKERTEHDALFRAAPRWARRLHKGLVWYGRLARGLRGDCVPRSVEYSIYRRGERNQRKAYVSPPVSAKWTTRL